MSKTNQDIYKESEYYSFFLGFKISAIVSLVISLISTIIFAMEIGLNFPLLLIVFGAIFGVMFGVMCLTQIITNLHSLDQLRDQERILGVKFRNRKDYDANLKDKEWFVSQLPAKRTYLNRFFIKEVRGIKKVRSGDSYHYELTYQDITNQIHKVPLEYSQNEVKRFAEWYKSGLEEADEIDIGELLSDKSDKKKKTSKR